MSDQAVQTDSELLNEFARSGSENSFEQLVRRHSGLVLRVCRGILRDSEDADDAAQAAFLTLARKASSLRSHRTIAGWLHTVAWHIANRSRRARQLRKIRERGAAASFERTNEFSTTDDSELAAALHEQIHALQDRYRLPLILHHLDGWSEVEVAQMLGCKLGTVSARLTRGRKMLKERLEARGVKSDRLEQSSKEKFDPSAAFILLAIRAGEASRRGQQVSAQAAALSDGAIHMMRRSRVIRLLTGVAIILLLIGGSIGIYEFTHSSDRSSVIPPIQMIATTGDIVGIVVGPDGNAVEGVTVRLYASRADANANLRALQHMNTSADGSFEFHDVSPRKDMYLLAFIQQPVFMHGDATTTAITGKNVNIGKIVLIAGRY